MVSQGERPPKRTHDPAIAQELGKLGDAELFERAEAEGVDDEKLDEAESSEEIIQLIMEKITEKEQKQAAETAEAAEKAAALKEELSALSLRKVLKLVELADEAGAVKGREVPGDKAGKVALLMDVALELGDARRTTLSSAGELRECLSAEKKKVAVAAAAAAAPRLAFTHHGPEVTLSECGPPMAATILADE